MQHLFLFQGSQLFLIKNPKLYQKGQMGIWVQRSQLLEANGMGVWGQSSQSPKAEHVAIFRIFQKKIKHFRPKFLLYNDTLMRARR